MSKRIFLTVDTECHDIRKFNRYIIGDTKRGNFGLERLLQLGKDLEVPVNVFLDIPECHSYGDEYIRNLVNLIKSYGHSIYLHVHPDYIADPKRKHLWEYSKEEQKNIIRQAIYDYNRFCGDQDRLFFRAGAWGVNADTYQVLSELQAETGISEIIDLSYVYRSRYRCHLSYKEYGYANSSGKYKGITVFPNTTYIGFDYLGKQYPFEICVPTPSFTEFKKVIDMNAIHNITYTMHSWDFIKRWFFLPEKVSGDTHKIKTFKKCIAYAKKKGYIFSDLKDYNLLQESDQCINLCDNMKGKFQCLWFNYLRFADMGRATKKYALLYFSPILILLIVIILIIMLV